MRLTGSDNFCPTTEEVNVSHVNDAMFSCISNSDLSINIGKNGSSMLPHNKSDGVISHLEHRAPCIQLNTTPWSRKNSPSQLITNLRPSTRSTLTILNGLARSVL